MEMDEELQLAHKEAKEKLNILLDKVEDKSWYGISTELKYAINDLLKEILYTFDYDSRRYIVEDMMDEVGIEIEE